MNTKHLDGWLYVGVAVCTTLAGCLNTDEAAKFFSPSLLFFSKTAAASIGAGLLAGKMYRSTTFANAQAKDEQESIDLPIKKEPESIQPAKV